MHVIFHMTHFRSVIKRKNHFYSYQPRYRSVQRTIGDRPVV